MKIINKLKKYKRYGEYHLRWQLSGLIMIPVVYLIRETGVQLWLNLVIAQVFGAIIFYKFDKWLLTHRIKEEEEAS